MLAPCRTNWMAPLSTCISGQMNGSGRRKIGEISSSFSAGFPNRLVIVKALTFVHQLQGWNEVAIVVLVEQKLAGTVRENLDMIMTLDDLD